MYQSWAEKCKLMTSLFYVTHLTTLLLSNVCRHGDVVHAKTLSTRGTAIAVPNEIVPEPEVPLKRYAGVRPLRVFVW